jgi:uncharacterized RDD family membrane protein YckC
MWYYMEDEQQRGPVMDADLEALRRDGKINPETLVWREGQTNWQPLREVQPGGKGQASQPPVLPPTGTATGVATGMAEVVCSQCGGLFPANDVIRYGNASVCAGCKPIFVQKLKEGANVVGGPMEYASFWTRFAAYFVDGIITGILSAIIGGVLGLAIGAAGGMSGDNKATGIIIIQVVSLGVGFCIRAAYFIYFIGKSGQTPGKKLCKIRVVNADGSQVTYGKATGRFFGYLLSSLILCIGFLMAAWDDEKRALHDRLCNTRVIKA